MRHTVTSRLTAITGVALMLLLSGCVASPSAGNPVIDQPAAGQAAGGTPSSAGPDAAAAQGQTPPATGPVGQDGILADTSAEKTASAVEAAATDTMKQTVTDALTGLAAGAPKPATAQVAEVLTAAGIAPDMLQVSQSRTPTGLEADAIEAAVLQGRDCVIGQVREGAVTVTVLPVLASGKCFVGS